MFAVPAPQPGRPIAATRSRLGIAAAMVLTATCCTCALAADFEPVTVAAADIPQRQFEISGSSLPRFDSSDNATQSNRIDLALMPSSRSGVGVALGLTSLSGSRWNSLAPARNPASPAVDVGLQWRYTLDSNYRIDVSAWRRMPGNDAIALIESREPSYGARVEMQMGASRSKGFTADKGFLGFQLESGARISVKRKNGGPMFYYRNAF
jgi:hypothetical protein